jgi:adenylate cyclase
MMGDRAEEYRGEVLLVDDKPDNLRFLATILKEKGYKVRAAINGAMAVATAKLVPPDIILLDVDMPQMDGYETCRRLKADEATREIPIIFISALDAVMDKVKAFGAGAVDYIAKPFQVAEVVARVETHITLAHLQQQLQVQNALLKRRLEQLEQAFRDRQAAEEKYRSIFENAIEGIYQTTPEGQFISANPALARLYGYDSVEDLINTVTDIDKQLYARPRRRDELIAYMRQYGDISDFDSQIYRKDGSIIWISENIRAVYEDGQLSYFEGTVQDVTERHQAETELRHQRTRAEQLLLNILPQPIAERLKQKQAIIADQLPDVTILFADIVSFTRLVAHMSPTELVKLLNTIFSEFDRLAESHGLEKIKTIGDAYMVAGGAPLSRPGHVEAVAEMALDMQTVIAQFQSDLGHPFQLRIGINTGPAIAGVIGTHKFTYDLWGHTVNLASRMESQGMPGRIQVTEATYERLHALYELEPRGNIPVKGHGEMTTYWLLRRKHSSP